MNILTLKKSYKQRITSIYIMNIESELEVKLSCKICNKVYASMSSLCNHNKKFHTNIKTTTVNIVNLNVNNKPEYVNLIKKIYTCENCNKNFSCRQSKYKHKTNTCNITIKNKNNNELELEKIKLEQINAEKEKINSQNEMIRLKIKLQNSKKIDNKTFKAVNKMLMERSFRNSNSNNTNCNNTNTNNTTNNTINNNIILSLGNEDLSDNLTSKEKIAILDRKYCSLEKIIELVHCGKHNKFKNILITNLKDNYAYKYDDKLCYFLTVPKNELLNDVVSNRIIDIEAICDELSKRNKIDDNTKEIIQLMVDKINDEKTTYYDDDGETNYTNYKSYKINNIKILLYNNNDNITRDIELLLSKYVNEKTIDI